MIDALLGSITVLDVIIIAIVIISTLMALSRGFLRELATLAALFFASIAAYCGRLFFRDTIASVLPDGTASYLADLIIVLLAFIIVYTLVRVIGGRFTSLVQGPEGVNIIDRMAGMIFGIARGLAVPLLATWLIVNVVPTDALPDFIAKSFSYPYFESAALALNNTAPEIAEQANDLLDTPEQPLPQEP